MESFLRRGATTVFLAHHQSVAQYNTNCSRLVEEEFVLDRFRTKISPVMMANKKVSGEQWLKHLKKGHNNRYKSVMFKYGDGSTSATTVNAKQKVNTHSSAIAEYFEMMSPKKKQTKIPTSFLTAEQYLAVTDTQQPDLMIDTTCSPVIVAATRRVDIIIQNGAEHEPCQRYYSSPVVVVTNDGWITTARTLVFEPNERVAFLTKEEPSTPVRHEPPFLDLPEDNDDDDDVDTEAAKERMSDITLDGFHSCLWFWLLPFLLLCRRRTVMDEYEVQPTTSPSE